MFSQTRTHSSLSVFGAAIKRRLAGLALRRLWILETDNLLLNDAIVLTLAAVVSMRVWKGIWRVRMEWLQDISLVCVGQSNSVCLERLVWSSFESSSRT